MAAGERFILLVEDDPNDEELTRLAFSHGNLVNGVVAVHDGEAALDFLFGSGAHAGRDTSVQPAVVLLDLKLPKVSGLEVLQRMRADPRTRAVPVVVLTSSSEDRDLVASYQLGCNSYVRKPVSFAEFTAAARQVGLYWLLLNELPR
jgi:CheY-like chemotaxis protein